MDQRVLRIYTQKRFRVCSRICKKIPGKEEFSASLDYFRGELERKDVDVQLNTRISAEDLAGYDEVILATGVHPRKIDLPGIDNSKVVSYIDVLNKAVKIGRSVAIIGAGGIGFDVAEFLSHSDDHHSDPSADPLEAFAKEWGIEVEERKMSPQWAHYLQLTPEPLELKTLIAVVHSRQLEKEQMKYFGKKSKFKTHSVVRLVHIQCNRTTQ